MRHNPLISPILHILRQSETAVSEYELMSQIAFGDDLIVGATTNYQLTLFKKHFMVMNALYALQGELVAEGVYLTISALHIALNVSVTESRESQLSDQGEIKLRDYYMDWRNYDETGEEDVQQLLAGFWRRYAAIDKQQQALQTLGLEADAGWIMIRDGYRRLAMQYHPDKGGDERKFIEVREAYELLRCCHDAV